MNADASLPRTTFENEGEFAVEGGKMQKVVNVCPVHGQRLQCSSLLNE